MFGIETIISTPDITFLLLTFGVYGMLFEATSPGIIFPGSFGLICFILGIFGLNALPIDYTGLAFMGLGILFMGAEALITSFGILAISGVISFAIGGSMLVNKEIYGYGVSWWLIAATTLTTVTVVIFIMKIYLDSRNKPSSTGSESLINTQGEIISWSKNKGEVLAAGTIWQAISNTDYILKKGDNIRVIDIDELCLIIEPEKNKHKED